MDKKEFFDSLQPAELDLLMKEDMHEDPVYEPALARAKAAVQEKTGLPAKAPRRRSLFPRRLAAACAALLVFAGTGLLISSQKAYADAVAFFEENGLSVEGLSRNEIRKVYLDISTMSFSYAGTAKVITENCCVPGFSVDASGAPAELTDPQALTQIWGGWISINEEKEYVAADVETEKGFHSLLRREMNGEVLWSLELEDFFVSQQHTVSDGLLLFGQEELYGVAYGSQNPVIPSRILKVSEDGRKEWDVPSDPNAKWFLCRGMWETEDGYCIILQGRRSSTVHGYDTLRFLHLTRNGEIRSCNDIPFNDPVGRSAPLGDGFLLLTQNDLESGPDGSIRLLRTDREGNPEDGYSFSEDGSVFSFCDFLEYDGSVYISVDCMPRNDAAGRVNRRYALRALDDLLYSDEGFLSPGERKLTGRLRAQYTAVLLKVDPVSGEPVLCYSADACLAGPLQDRDGRLIWQVSEIKGSTFSPSTSAFSFCGDADVFEYRINAGGLLYAVRKVAEGTYYI